MSESQDKVRKLIARMNNGLPVLREQLVDALEQLSPDAPADAAFAETLKRKIDEMDGLNPMSLICDGITKLSLSEAAEVVKRMKELGINVTIELK